MILWNDFVMDDKFGPSLNIQLDWDEVRKSPQTRLDHPSIMEDAKDKAVLIQETGQGQRPARMVGFTGLDSISGGMEATWGDPARSVGRKGEA